MEEKKNGVAEEQHQKTDAGRRKFLTSTAVLGVGLPLTALVDSRIVQAAEAQKDAAVLTNASGLANATGPGNATGLSNATATAPAAAAPPAPKAPKAQALMVERRRCTGCNSCVFACSIFHDGVVRPSTARVHVLRHQGIMDVPVICWHCPDAPCVAACPVTPEKAIMRDDKANIVKFTDEKRCISCGSCVAACPPKFLRLHPDTNHPMFCDLCGGDPECVKACDRQSRETGQTLSSNPVVGGLHLVYREVTPQKAIEGLMVNMYYPNLDGKRR